MFDRKAAMDETPPLTGSAKNELISRLKAASEPSVAASASNPTPNAQDENRALFMSAMSDPVRRQIAFNVVERNCRINLLKVPTASSCMFGYLLMFD